MKNISNSSFDDIFSALFEIEEIKLKKDDNYIFPVNHINHYINSGFKKVCNIKSTYHGNKWFYTNIDNFLMYSTHSSWVYMITVNGWIVKIGECGNPLGIRIKNSDQPLRSSKSRLGRYISGDKSDVIVREWLRRDTQSTDSEVSIYAYKCPESIETIFNLEEKITAKSQVHKDLELQLLDYFKKYVGSYPMCNVGRK